MKRFDELRQTCIQILLTSVPDVVVPVMTWLLYESDTLCLSTRMEILDELVSGAYTLAAIQPPSGVSPVEFRLHRVNE